MPKIITSSPVKIFCSLALCAILSSPASSNAAQTQGIPQTIDINTQTNQADIAGLPEDKKYVNSFSHQKHMNTYLKGKAKFSQYPYTDEFTCTACHPGSRQ